MIKIETNKELAAFVVLIVVLCFGAFQIVYAKTINILSDATMDVAYFVGKVGTNGNPPNRNLHLYNDNKVNTEIDIQSVAGTNNHWAIYVYNDESNNSLRFWNNNISGEKNILTINNRGGAGSVGIGTTNPVYKLDVNGSINASAGYYWSGSAGVNNTYSNIVPTTYNIWNIWTSISGVNTTSSPTTITVKNPSSQICYMYFTSGIFTSSTCP